MFLPCICMKRQSQPARQTLAVQVIADLRPSLLTHCSACCHPLPQRGWEVSGGRVTFQGAAMEEDRGAAAAEGGLAAQDLINHCLAYAKELERIV